MTERVPSSGPRMLALVAEFDGPALWRILWPFTALQHADYVCGWDRKDNPLVAAVASGFDGFVMPRLRWDTEYRRIAESWFRQVARTGQVVVYDLDDDILTSASTHHLLASGLNAGVSFAELEQHRFDAIWAVQQCDGVTVSTRRLATIARSFTTRPVIVVPNAIDLPWFRGVLRAADRRVAGLTIGWTGGQRADSDVEPMAEAWGRIAARYPGVTFVVGGYQPDVIAAHVPADRVVRLPWLPLERYPAHLREIDIACCSVAENRFNRGKSPIKAIEAGAAGCAVVASPVLYGAVVEDGRTGYLAETVDEWERALARLVERQAERRILARRLTRVVEREHALAVNLWRWPDAWQQVADAARVRRESLVTV